MAKDSGEALKILFSVANLFSCEQNHSHAKREEIVNASVSQEYTEDFRGGQDAYELMETS